MKEKATKEVNTITIWHEEFGVMVEETFVDEDQFEIFIKSVNSSYDMGTAFRLFTGNMLVHIPNKVLHQCVIFTKEGELDLNKLVRSRAEALVTTKNK